MEKTPEKELVQVTEAGRRADRVGDTEWGPKSPSRGRGLQRKRDEDEDAPIKSFEGLRI